MTEAEFTKLFQYIQEFRDETAQKFSEVNDRFSQVYLQLDQQALMITDSNQELAALSNKIDRVIG